MPAHTAYDVYLHGRHIDTVFYCDANAVDDVKRGLINHDGYNPAIIVIESKPKRTIKVRTSKA